MPGRRVPRAGLSRQAVTTAALDVIDAGGTTGFGTLTLASVAGQVGVAVPSLYKHVASLTDLRRSVAILCVTEFTATIESAAIGRAGSEALRAVAHAMRAFATAHPGRYAATQVAADPADPADAELAAASAATLTALARVLRGFDLPADLTVEAIRIMRSALHGFIVLELGGGFKLPDDLDRSFELLVTIVIAGIDTLAAGIDALTVE